ncbi:MAG: addiction module toxin RelE [Candidatus Dadabacteria bacterium]|nr:addiction module toxin RelE [Candidatus Dadabacteria bacterium]NIQ14690.1 addiction module toxin RelE [Candidatus Dadabacteria bacterium]
MWLDVLDHVCNRFNWNCLTYCLMSDRYHLIIKTNDPNLSAGMRQLNGIYTQNFNRKYNIGGHVFQGRYKSILVQENKYLLPLINYICSLPLKAGFVKHPNQFKWCSCKYLYGKESLPKWMETDWYKSNFSDIDEFDKFISKEDSEDILNKVRKQIYLGDDEFILSLQIEHKKQLNLNEIPKTQITKPVSSVLEDFKNSGETENSAVAKTYLTGHYTLKEIGDFLGIHYSSVSKIVKEYEASL